MLTQSIDKDDLLRPKIDFSLKELNLLPQVEAELLNNLTEYVKNKGLDDIENTLLKTTKENSKMSCPGVGILPGPTEITSGSLAPDLLKLLEKYMACLLH